MANYNEHKCFTCGQIFDYCRRCAITPVIHKAEGFCSEKCSHIFNTLSKHSCNLISADEALKELSAYNLDNTTLTENILEYIKKIKAEATPVEKEDVDPAVNITNKNNKKKW